MGDVVVRKRQYVAGILLGVAVCAASCGSREASVDFPGTVIVASGGKGSALSAGVYALTADRRKPRRVRKRDHSHLRQELEETYPHLRDVRLPLPGAYNEEDDSECESSLLRHVSSDCRYEVVECEQGTRLQDAASGETVVIPLEEPMTWDKDPRVHWSFSPSGRHLLYSVEQESALYLYDIQAGSATVLHRGPCAVCLPGGTVCSDTWGRWLGDDYVELAYYDGSMPQRLDSADVDASKTSIISVNRENRMDLAGKRELSYHAGKCFVCNVLSICNAWIEPAGDGSGALDFHPLPRLISLEGVSPDGRYALVPGQPWRLLDLPTGHETLLGTSTENASPLTICFWSSDSAAAMCEVGFAWVTDEGWVHPTGQRALIYVPISDSPGGPVIAWDIDGLGDSEQLKVVGWLP